MSTNKRLTELFKLSSEKPIAFDDSSKFIIFSDCHRGDNDWADDFADNQNIFFHALNYYYNNDFTYIELGDGDELFENRNFRNIRKSYSHIFWLMSEFYKNSLKIEKILSEWSIANKQILIAGHTHRPIFPKLNESLFFNSGSCVHPRCITGIEIQNNEISLIKWCIKTKNDGTLYIDKEVLVCPKQLRLFYT